MQRHVMGISFAMLVTWYRAKFTYIFLTVILNTYSYLHICIYYSRYSLFPKASQKHMIENEEDKNNDTGAEC